MEGNLDLSIFDPLLRSGVRDAVAISLALDSVYSRPYFVPHHEGHTSMSVRRGGIPTCERRLVALRNSRL
jgi:hypothetical protein